MYILCLNLSNQRFLKCKFTFSRNVERLYILWRKDCTHCQCLWYIMQPANSCVTLNMKEQIKDIINNLPWKLLTVRAILRKSNSWNNRGYPTQHPLIIMTIYYGWYTCSHNILYNLFSLYNPHDCSKWSLNIQANREHVLLMVCESYRPNSSKIKIIWT
jgi:hypothetical protein